MDADAILAANYRINFDFDLIDAQLMPFLYRHPEELHFQFIGTYFASCVVDS
jgi:hypothetical protein